MDCYFAPSCKNAGITPTMFKMREFLLRKKQKELSEYKAMYIIKGYFLLFLPSITQKHPRIIKGSPSSV